MLFEEGGRPLAGEDDFVPAQEGGTAIKKAASQQRIELQNNKCPMTCLNLYITYDATRVAHHSVPNFII